MKNFSKLTLLFALIFTASTAFAQFEFIPKVGINASSFDNELDDGTTTDEARVGWNAGFDMRFGSDNTIFFQPGIHYNRFTARLINENVIDNENLNFDERVKYETVKIPLNVGINFIENDVFDLYGIVGVVPTAFLGTDTFDEVDFDDDDINSLSVGADAGLGIDLFNLLNISVNYEVGLTDFFDNGSDARINMLTLGVGIVL